MEDLISYYITQLGIISRIPTGCSLTCTNGQFSIYRGSISEWVYRKWSGNGRITILKYLKILYSDIINASNHIINTGVFHIAWLQSLEANLDASRVGLDSLCKIYIDDESFKISIQTLKSTIIIPQLSIIHEFIESKL